MNGATRDRSRRVFLLAAQAFALGLGVAWVLIPASAIFLDTYGSGLLPVTYLGAAAAGAASTVLLARALRRRPLTSVTIRILGATAATLVASWLLLWLANVGEVSFGLLVVVPILIPVGFVFVVGQAGMLLDVRAMKSLYPRVIGGFALGFVTGGVLGPALVALFGRTEHLLAADSAVAVLFLALVALTRRCYPAELSVVEHDDDVPRPTVRSLLSNRFVLLLAAYQMLSAVESQWLDYLVYDRAGARYRGEELARFIGRFTAITYATDIVFLLLIAGFLLRRWGLRLGLAANPGVVLALVAAMLTAGLAQGAGATVVFVLIVATRVSDLVLSDGTTRTSVGAGYQAIPLATRLAAQANVEGLAVPVAIGFSGIVIMILRATVGTDGLALPVLTTLVLSAWVVVALQCYRSYRVNLLENLRHRTLDPAELTIDSANTFAVIERLLESEHDRDVRLGLDALTFAGHPSLAGTLARLSAGDRIALRVEALERLGRTDGPLAAGAARLGLGHASPAVRAASLSTLADVGSASDVAAVAALADDPETDVALAAAAALSRIGDDAARAIVAARIVSRAGSADPQQRIVAARMLARCEPGPWLDRSAVDVLVGDPDPAVANAGLAAVRSPDDDVLLARVVGLLESRSTASAAVDALVRSGKVALALADTGLSGRLGLGAHAQELLTRVCRSIGTREASAVLAKHLAHADRDVGLAVTSALAGLDVDAIALDVTGMVRVDLVHATRVLQALDALVPTPSAATLCAALRDELRLLRRRVLAGLALRYGTEGVSRVAFQLAQHDTRVHAVALEWLDVTLTGTDRAAVGLLDPALPDDLRLRTLARTFPVQTRTASDIVRDIVVDPDGTWRQPWLTACALLAVADLDGLSIDDLAPHLRRDGGDGDIVGETLVGLRRRLDGPAGRPPPRSSIPA